MFAVTIELSPSRPDRWHGYDAKGRRKGAGNPSPGWERGRDEGLPSPKKVAAARLRLHNQRHTLTPAPLPSGRGVPRAGLEDGVQDVDARHRGERDGVAAAYEVAACGAVR